MKFNAIGRTNIRVSDLSFGCASIGNLYREVSDAEANAVLGAAWAAGIRYFDTAPHYGRGLSEIRLGRFLRDQQDVVISTKVGRILSPAARSIPEADGFINPAQNDVRYDYSGDGIEESFEQSLHRLGRTKLDILYVHDIGTLIHGSENVVHMEAFLGSGYERLVRLKEAGRISAFGLGVNECQVCLDVLAHGPLDVILLAGRHTILDQSARDRLLPLCAESGVSLVIGGVFNSGILATGAKAGGQFNYRPAPPDVLAEVARLEAICARHDVPLVSAALQYPARNPVVASTLIGTGRQSSLGRNLEHWKTAIPQALWSDLSAAGLA